MPKLLERRRKPRRKAVPATGPSWVMLEKVPGARADVRAKVVDFSETGIRIHVSVPLRVNHVITVKSESADVVPERCANARVVDCRPLPGSGYSAGLTFKGEDGDNATEVNYYEILQVSAKADLETIQGVYRLQAARYHPDNPATGDAKMFQAVAEAYNVLSDPHKREAYDLQLEFRR